MVAWQEITIARKHGSLTQTQIEDEERAIREAADREWIRNQHENWLHAMIFISIASYTAHIAAEEARQCVDAMLVNPGESSF
jgi:hypothetical protein